MSKTKMDVPREYNSNSNSKYDNLNNNELKFKKKNPSDFKNIESYKEKEKFDKYSDSSNDEKRRSSYSRNYHRRHDSRSRSYSRKKKFIKV